MQTYAHKKKKFKYSNHQKNIEKELLIIREVKTKNSFPSIHPSIIIIIRENKLHEKKKIFIQTFTNTGTNNNLTKQYTSVFTKTRQAH